MSHKQTIPSIDAAIKLGSADEWKTSDGNRFIIYHSNYWSNEKRAISEAYSSTSGVTALTARHDGQQPVSGAGGHDILRQPAAWGIAGGVALMLIIVAIAATLVFKTGRRAQRHEAERARLAGSVEA